MGVVIWFVLYSKVVFWGRSGHFLHFYLSPLIHLFFSFLPIRRERETDLRLIHFCCVAVVLRLESLRFALHLLEEKVGGKWKTPSCISKLQLIPGSVQVREDLGVGCAVCVELLLQSLIWNREFLRQEQARRQCGAVGRRTWGGIGALLRNLSAPRFLPLRRNCATGWA